MPTRTARPSTDMLTEAFLDGLDLGRMERLRYSDDFPTVPSPYDEYTSGWPYSDEDEG